MFKHADQTYEQAGASGQPNALQRQAADLLCSPDSRSAFIKSLNADSDQVRGMLEQEESAEMFDALKELDENQALDYAERNPSIQTHALHGTDDKAFQQNLRGRLTGNPLE